MWGGSLREIELKERTWRGEGLGGGTCKVKSRKARGRDELIDGREAAKEPHWVGCGIRGPQSAKGGEEWTVNMATII